MYEINKIETNSWELVIMSKKNNKNEDTIEVIDKEIDIDNNEKKEPSRKEIFISNVKGKIKRGVSYSIHTWIFKCFIIALILELVLEILGRRSLFLGFKFMLTQPIVYLYNVSIVFFTLLFALFLKKRVFGLVTITVLWIACGIINFVVLGYRVTPFAAIDFLMFLDVFSMLDVYLTKFQQVLVLIAVIATLVCLVILFRKSPKFDGDRKVKGTMLLCALSWFFVWGMTNFAVKHNIISDDFANLGMAYQDYGFVYCFTNSIIDNGIDKSDDYGKYTLDIIENDLADVKETGEKKTPNVIMIQLESFFDPNNVDGLTLSENPIPTFVELKAKYPSGYLTVPSIGAGTANTEFEVLTGISSGFFGAGEYAYKTTVNETPVESLCSVLKGEGYGTYAIHNNKSSFYDRKNVYEKMGFDAFISLEYMYDVEYTSTKWAKDATLVTDIFKCMDETEGQDFVFTISLQGHGVYPEAAGSCDVHVDVEFGETEGQKNQMTYYINQLYEMDLMIADLIEKLDARGEDYVLVLYGDHLPSIGIEEEHLNGHSLFQTEYIIVNNIGIELEDEDIVATELSVKLLDELNITGGYAHKAYAYYSEDVLEEKLHLIAYDMLFGDKYLFDDGVVVPENDMQMGVDIISVSSINNERDHMVVTGQNFNEYSVVYCGDKDLETTYIDRQTLMVEGEIAEAGEEYSVKQVDKSHHILSSSEVFIY